MNEESILHILIVMEVEKLSYKDAVEFIKASRLLNEIKDEIL